MAFRSAPVTDDILWRTPLAPPGQTLASTLREDIARQRPALLEFARFDETPPPQAMALDEWRSGSRLRSLLAAYSDHLYRNDPARLRENKPLLSLWAQWYFGLQVPPLLLALLTAKVGFSLDPRHFQVEFHETGRAACFWNAVVPDTALAALPPMARVERMVTQTLAPVVAALEETGEINGKLIWSNTGYLINWYLGDLKPLIGDAMVDELRQHLFFSRHFSDGGENPLWRTVVLRDGALVRRTCCQRYRLPDVQQCGDCTLKK